MDFRLSEEQLAMQETVRKFAQKEVKPTAAEYDMRVDPKDRFPWHLWRKAHAMGLVSLPMSEKWGGGGADLLAQVIVSEELGAGDAAFGHIIGTHMKNVHFMSVLLNEEQQEEFIPQFMKDDTYVIAFGVTEPESSSDNLLPYDEPGVALKTFAFRDGNDYVINGTKHFVTLGAVAKLYIIMVRTDKAKPITRASSAFLVPAGTPGFSVGHLADEMGGRTEARADLVLEDVRVPARYLVGEQNRAYGPNMAVLLPDFLCTVAAGLGEARTCYEETKAYAKIRVQGGKPIIEHINVGTRIADMHVAIEASRTLIHKVAWSFDNQHEFDPKMVYLTNAFVDDLLTKIYLDAFEIWAGPGVQKELPIERYFRNHFSTLHGSGTPVLNRIKVMKML